MTIANCLVAPSHVAGCTHQDATPVANHSPKPPSLSRLQPPTRRWHALCNDMDAMKVPHSQANRSGRTLWSVPFLCAVLLSLPAHAIEVRIDPPPSPEKTIRGLRALFHRTVKQPRNAPDQARALAVAGRSEQVARTPESATRSRRVASSRQQDSVTLDDQRSAPQRTRKVERPKSSTPTAPASENETLSESVAPAPQPQNSSQAAPVPVATVAFARPVPGKKGIVYPPGSDETPDTEIDVSELQPGELARDPRTGNIFRVP
jgi:hypothetical protein